MTARRTRADLMGWAWNVAAVKRHMYPRGRHSAEKALCGAWANELGHLGEYDPIDQRDPLNDCVTCTRKTDAIIARKEALR